MSKPLIIIKADGREYSLNAWAVMHQMNPSTVAYRYKMGERDPEKLVSPLRNKGRRPLRPTKEPEELTEDDLRYIAGVAKFSEGQPEQTKMLCDFAGIDRKHGAWLRKRLEGMA